MLPQETINLINRLLYQVDDQEARVAAVARFESAEELQYYAIVFNWDDGFAVPQAIAEHPKCDLGTALTLFWLAEGTSWYTGEVKPSEYNREWVAFCSLVTDRIVRGDYLPGDTSFEPDLSVIQRHKLKKLGLPDILIDPVVGPLPPPCF